MFLMFRRVLLGVQFWLEVGAVDFCKRREGYWLNMVISSELSLSGSVFKYYFSFFFLDEMRKVPEPTTILKVWLLKQGCLGEIGVVGAFLVSISLIELRKFFSINMCYYGLNSFVLRFLRDFINLN